MLNRSSCPVFALAVVLALAVPQAGVAQTGGAADPQTGQESFQLTEQKFEAFIVAALEIIKIRQAWSPRIQEAADDTEAEEMMETARGEMQSAVEGTPGISPEEYIGIARAAQQNPELAQAIEARIRAEQQPVQ